MSTTPPSPPTWWTSCPWTPASCWATRITKWRTCATTATCTPARASPGTAPPRRPGAKALQAEALTLRRESVGPWGAAFPLAGVAELILDDSPAFTARLLGVLDAMEALRGDLPMHFQAARATMTDAVRCALGNTAFEAARAAGRSLPLEQAVAEALAFVTIP